MKDQPPIFFNRYQHPFGHTSGASEIILTDPIYRLVAGGETSPWTKPSCGISPRVIFRRIGVRAEIRTQNPVLSNARLAKMVSLSHLRRPFRYLLRGRVKRVFTKTYLDVSSIRIFLNHSYDEYYF
jgi:hypothetical protein